MSGFQRVVEELEEVYEYHNERKLALEEEKRMIQNQIENSEDEMSLCSGAMNNIQKMFNIGPDA
jgi:hypothetical protein